MFDGLDPDLAARLIMASIGVAIGLVALIAGLYFLRRRNSHLFVKGGRAREHRLVVLDAAAVDAKRRLVLIRRDNVEHLIMIGGPSDIVIETGIGDDKNRNAAVNGLSASLTPTASADLTRDMARPAAEIVPPSQAVRPVAASTAANQTMANPPAASQPAAAAGAAAPAVAMAEPARPAPQADRKPVSAMGSVLYSEDREPLTGAKTQPRPAIAPAVTATAAPAPAPAIAAESILEQARNRVLVQPAETRPKVEAARPEPVQGRVEAPRIETPRVEPRPPADDETRTLALRLETAKLEAARQEAARQEAARLEAARIEAARLEAAKLETARIEAARRAQAAQVVQQAAAPAPARAEDPRKADVSLQSEFEKFLEAELQAGGIVDGPAPAGERVTSGQLAPPLGGARREP